MTPRPALDLSLYLVTDTALCAGTGVAATVRAAVAGGVSVVQLRDPSASDAELVALGREVRAALAATGVPLLVNDRVHLVAEIGAQGAHVGQSDLDPAGARRMLGAGARLGLSVQEPEHLAALADLEPRTVDYLGVGPVWPQATKPDAAPPIGVEGLRDLVGRSRWPCVAIGGVDARRVPEARAAGVAGVAVVSAICGRPDPADAARALRRAWERAS